ncbi:gliding motility-associated C-terminal domain-containing protein [Muricauda ruestringensis]|uniref:gliding motility-associated C-terminal domain-containing protein n=1 Tax=Flagellimonas ruestringensis TaxID=111501 RepID=UPI001CD3F8D3|nr:gliding motility-associated C-terminal domain-containing protein [Allomuricauda ruestringensis]MCA0960306.1 gliding motility-associated C-terminal domain-containing protein [Allomuricauda ruestringensis]
MKTLLHIAFLLSVCSVVAQSGLYHNGNMQVHNNANIGLHTDFINNANFNPATGLVGFYGNEVIQVSGNVSPTLWDTEIMSRSNVFFQIPVSVRNNVNFIDGNFLSPANNQAVYLNFMDKGFFTGESNESKVTGFAAVNNRDIFSFPVGDQAQLRPLTLLSQSTTPLAICAYFFENPSNPSSILESFDTDQKVQEIGKVSEREFWILQSDVPAQVSIAWNVRSGLGTIPNATMESIIIVGWSKAEQEWVIIGNSATSGDINRGFITSETFVPSEYAAITFGTIPLPTDTFAVNNPTLGNYFLSPNGDGINDSWIIDNLEESPNNSVRIFNRYGQKVFEQINYTNEFHGIANTGTMISNQGIGLPEGVYFYLVTLEDVELEYTGFLFLDR